MKCFVYVFGEDKKLKSKIRYHCHYHKLNFKTFKKAVVVFADEQPKTNWDDVTIIEATHGVDIVGNEFFIKKD